VQQNYQLANENLAAIRRVEEISRAPVKAGDLSEVDLMRVEIAVLELENEVSKFREAPKNEWMRCGTLLRRCCVP
jgi:outer membrane protein TolC